MNFWLLFSLTLINLIDPMHQIKDPFSVWVCSVWQ